MHPDWIVPDWPAPPGVHAVFTTRRGGRSKAPFDSLNLGDHVGDDAQDVATNRVCLQSAMPARPVFLSQVHGVQVIALDIDTASGTQADACLAAQPGVACTIMVADCLPVLFTHARGGVVAAAHAGWRGLAGLADPGGKGILEASYERFVSLALAKYAQLATEFVASDMVAWLGPCIGPRCFEVGGEVRAAFMEGPLVANHPRMLEQVAAMFVPLQRGKWLADLAGLARLRLQALGIRQIYGNDSSSAWCTVSNASRFFSHRRDSVALGGSGRMAACVWLD